MNYRSFLLKCIEEEIIPNALKYTIEPSTGNYNEEFLTMWHKIQKGCLIKAMKLIRDFWDQTLYETNLAAIKSLKQNTSNEKFVKLKHEIYEQERQSKSNLQQKTKKLNNLRYRVPSNNQDPDKKARSIARKKFKERKEQID